MFRSKPFMLCALFLLTSCVVIRYDCQDESEIVTDPGTSTDYYIVNEGEDFVPGGIWYGCKLHNDPCHVDYTLDTYPPSKSCINLCAEDEETGKKDEHIFWN